jgi:polysaccharide biosynthesis/export protein
VKLLALAIVWTIPFFAQAQSGVRRADAIQYTLAPNDHILIHTAQTKKIEGRIFQIQADGFVTIPTIGHVRAAGLTISSLEQLVARRLKGNTSSAPKVAIAVVASSRS